MADPEGEWIENVFEVNPKKTLEEPIPIPRSAEAPSMEMTCALVWVSGPSMGCIFFNESWLSFRGRSLQEESGNGWAQGVHPDDLNRCLSIYQTSFQQRKDFLMDYRLLRRDGVYRWIRDKGSPTYSAEGLFSGYVGACVEIHKDGSAHGLAFTFPTKNLKTSATIFDDLNKQQQQQQQQQLRRQQFQHLQQQLMKLCQPPPFLPSPSPFPTAQLPTSAHLPRPKKDTAEYELMKRNMLLEQLSLLGRETHRGTSFFPPSDPFSSGGVGMGVGAGGGAGSDFDHLGLFPPGSQSTRPVRATPSDVDSKMGGVGPSPFPDLFQNLGATSSNPTASGSDASPLLHEALLLEQKRILAQQFREQLVMSMQLQKLQNFQHMMHASIGSEMASHLQAALFHQQQLDPHAFRRLPKKSQAKHTDGSPELASLASPVNIVPLGFKDNLKRRRFPDSDSSPSLSPSETPLAAYERRGQTQRKKSKKKYPKEVKVQPILGQTIPLEATTLSSTTSNLSVASRTSAFPLLSASYAIEEATPAKVKSTSSGYVCPYAGCTETPRSKFSFNRHLKLHAGTRPYICTYPDCAKKFLESNTLKRHARIHTGERPFVCPVPGCGKSFTDASNFKRHERSHTGEKPYKCVLEGCGRSFTRGSSLKNHLTSHHKLPVTSQELLSAMQTASTLRKQNPSSPSDRVPILKVKKPRRERHASKSHRAHHLLTTSSAYNSPSSDPSSSSPSPATSPSTPVRFQFSSSSLSSSSTPSSLSSTSSSSSSSPSPSSPSSPSVPLGATTPTPN